MLQEFTYLSIWKEGHWITRLTSLQNRAAKIIMGLSRRSHLHLLLSKLRILAIDQIRIMQTSELMFKHMHNLLPHAFADFFTLTSALVPYNLRSSLNYRRIITRTNTRLFSIKSAGPRTWNNLPLSIQNSLCFTLFKRKLKSHLLYAVSW